MLNPNMEWHAENRERLEHFIHENAWKYGDSKPQPVAVFDWDNTVIKNDIGDYFFLWMLRNDKVFMPAGGDWKISNIFLSEKAASRLKEVTRSYLPGQILNTSHDDHCADEFVSIYTRGKTIYGHEAFAGYNHRTMEPAYAWASQLLAGYTPEQIRSFARTAINEALSAEKGSKISMASFTELDGWVRIYDQMRDLISQLHEHNFDVWIVSASNQYIIEVFAAELGIRAERVIGVRPLLDKNGLISYRLKGCGLVADGENSLITYRLGKRCWINSEIFGISPELCMQKPLDPCLRPIFAAGDSDTDMPFVADASGLRLAINRNRSEIMCNALNNADGRWLINPMFIDPLPKRKNPYQCSTSACIAEDGTASPCLLDSGETISDQME